MHSIISLGLLALMTACTDGSVSWDMSPDETPTDTGCQESTWYRDLDEDGYGDADNSMLACDAPDGYVGNALDCDDTSFAINPGANEVCNGLDDDCDNEVDDGNAWYLDHDADGYGDSAFFYEDGCDGSTYLVANPDDCDDTNADVNPAAEEVCDEVDNDCDGQIDIDATDASIWHIDADGDGQGSEESMESCDQPSGYVASSGDCNDHDPDVYEGATEVCDEVDNDCDGDVDEGAELTFYADADEDGYGNPDATTEACTAPDGYIEDATDCNDSSADAFPGATEVCDGIDNDCDGEVDADATDASTWFADADEDGYGNCLEDTDACESTVACEQPDGYVDTTGDCDDTDASVNPDATEVCDGVDNDCDGSIDPSSATDAGTWYYDGDADNYGDEDVSIVQCDQPSGYVDNTGDCDDSDGEVNPDATEVCDGLDNDCDEDIDPDTSADASLWYPDVDEDSYGDEDGTASTSCEAPSGYVSDSSDCNDLNEDVNPGATEVCNEVDDDCDGDVDEDVELTFYADADEDGYGDETTTIEACTAPDGYVANDNDCDDDEGTTNPDADEYCDSVDNDCDGDIDPDDSLDASEWYFDLDEDGYGDESDSTVACDQPSGYVATDTDCDDENADVNPGESENSYALCTDELDNDCDEDIDADDVECYTDGDLDGQTPLAGDCDNEDATVYDGATETCDDDVDQDCDGEDDVCEVVDTGDTGDTGSYSSLIEIGWVDLTNSSITNGAMVDVYKFNVSASSDGDVSTNQFQLSLDWTDTDSDSDLELESVMFYQDGSDVTSSVSITDEDGNDVTDTDGLLEDDETLIVTWDPEGEISAAETVTFIIRVTPSGFDTGDSVSLFLGEGDWESADEMVPESDLDSETWAY